MGSPICTFDDLRRHPRGRELRRHGEPVAIAAAWGRSDVSGNLFAQTIMRLRGVLPRCRDAIPNDDIATHRAARRVADMYDRQ